MDFKSQIRKQALERPDQEVCGFVIEGDVRPMENIAKNPKETFVIPVEDFLNAGSIEYIYHSHPESGCEPSRADRLYCSELQIPFVIYSVLDDEFYILTPRRYTPPRESV